MSKMDSIEVGTRVRFLANSLGVLETKDKTWFADDTVTQGDEGTYDGPHEAIRENNWHWVKLDDGRFVPVHVSQFEVAS